MKKKRLKASSAFGSNRHKPIGVFDSGLGGLTVVRQIRCFLPSEEIIYLGDLAHLPYGTKSDREIKRRSEDCAKFLLAKKVKAIVVACNSASSVAYKTLQRKIRIPVIDVMTPAVREALRRSKASRIGVIATQATIESGSYARALKAGSKNAQFFLRSCPLFVPLVEEGWLKGPITESAIRQYLLPMKERGIDTLILGCTHYPLLKSAIAKVLGSKVRLIDSAYPTAAKLSSLLKEKKLFYPKRRKTQLKVYATDFVRHFSKIGESFLGEKLGNVKLVKVP